MGTNNNTRRRRRNKESSSHQSGSTFKAANVSGDQVKNQNDSAKEDEEVPMWHVIRKHPLFWALLLLGIPYSLHLGYRWIVLQHPPEGWRPAVAMNDTRQVLILGSMSSGTSSMAKALQDLDLEVGHEDSDTLWKFVRDGTVSWFHGIRYFSDSSRIRHLCAVNWKFRENRQNYGFVSENDGFVR